jgi:tetratricopeptide (TPR) repeat protein
MAVLLDVSDRLLLGWASVVEGVGYYLQGAFDVAFAPLERARRGWGEGGNKSVLAASLMYLGLVEAARNDIDQAGKTFEAALRTYRDIGTTWGIAGSLLGIGMVACERAEYTSAAALIDESLAMRRAARNRHGIAECLELGAQLRLATGDPEGARHLLTEAQLIRDSIGTPLPAWRRAALTVLGAST